jgi:NAD(P)-dependent dehydrogenase (short-subunit alcohol dehydrogenase family)
MAEEFFRGKVALITGSSRGIGNAIARRFSLAGADLALNFRKGGGASQKQGEELRDEILALGRRAILIQADISDRESVKKMLERTRENFERLDFLVLNAARAPFKPLERLLERELRQLLETNFLGNIFCVQEALPLLAESGGKIVFISSLGSRFYSPSYPLGSVKAAMEAAVRDLAESLRPKHVSVNGICAGLVKTDSFKVLRQYSEELDRLPENLFVHPDEIADVTLFLCSPQSRGLCGQTIVVDHGLSNRLSRALGET